MHAFVALYRGGVTQPNSPIIFDDAPRPGVSDPTPTLTRHIEVQKHIASAGQPDAKLITTCRKQRILHYACRCGMGTSNRNGRYTE